MANVFISWSGEESKSLAKVLAEWIPSVINAANPWMSEESIEKGKNWQASTAEALESSRIGIVCITAENLRSPWVLFEAGALSKQFEQSHVCTLLLKLSPEDIPEPLRQFQATQPNKQDIHRLLVTINDALGRPLTDRRLDMGFEQLWPKLNYRLEALLATYVPPTGRVQMDGQLEEILHRVRLIHSEVRGRVSPRPKGAARALLASLNHELSHVEKCLQGYRMAIENLGFVEGLSENEIEDQAFQIRVKATEAIAKRETLDEVREMVIRQFHLDKTPEGAVHPDIS